MNWKQKEFHAAEPAAQSEALSRMTAIFACAQEAARAEVWRAFFLSDDFLREQYSETFADSMVQYLSQWEGQKSKEGFFSALASRIVQYLSQWEAQKAKKGFFTAFAARVVRALSRRQKASALPARYLPGAFLTELAVAYVIAPRQGRYSVEVPESFPARETVLAYWTARMEKMEHLPLKLLDRPDSVVCMRAFADYMRLKKLNGSNALLPGSRKVWSDILMNGQPRCLEKPDNNAGYLEKEQRGECLIRLFTFWIQSEAVPACVLECMYREYNLKTVDHSAYRNLYAPLKQEILRQHPAVEKNLYGEGTKTQQLAACYKELAGIISDNHSNYDHGIYEETDKIRERVRTFFDSASWHVLQCDMELFDKIFTNFHARRVMPESLSRGLMDFYSRAELWGAEQRAQQFIAEGLIPSIGFSRRIREIEGIAAEPEKTAPEAAGGSMDFWQYYLTWGFGLSKVSAKDERRAHKYQGPYRDDLPHYMEKTYFPSLLWQKRFTGFDSGSPASLECRLPDQKLLRVEFHLHYVLYWLDGEPVHKPQYTFEELLQFAPSLERVELFFFLFALTAVDNGACGEAAALAETWLYKTPLYPQTVPEIARLMAELCCRRQAQSRKITDVWHREGEQFCMQAVEECGTVTFYCLNDFAWQRVHTVAADGHKEQALWRELEPPAPVSLGTVSLEGLTPKEKAEQIIKALKRPEASVREAQRARLYHEKNAPEAAEKFWQTDGQYLTESYCVLHYGEDSSARRVLYCAMAPYGTDLAQRSAESQKQYEFNCRELDKKVKEKHVIAGHFGWGDTYTPKEICEAKPFAVGESGTYYYYKTFRMCRGDGLPAILPQMYELDNVTAVEWFAGYLSVSRIDNSLQYCYGREDFLKSVHSPERTGADYLTAFTETKITAELALWLDRLFAACAKTCSQPQFALRYAEGGYQLEVTDCAEAEALFYWNCDRDWQDALEQVTEEIRWYLENGTHGWQLQSCDRISIVYRRGDVQMKEAYLYAGKRVDG